MFSTRHTTSRLTLLFLLLALVVLPLAGCDSGSWPGSASGSSSGPASPDDQSPVISGQVVYRDTGKPYAGAWVEFRNLSGWQVNTTTDTNGHYSLKLDAGTYTADAGDDNNLYEAFDVVGQSGNAVSVPPSTTVNFIAWPIT